MKIVHSLWSKPLKDNTTSGSEKNFGGWRSLKYYYMSWALSCLSFKKFYPKISLVTDRHGYELLVEKLQLPYSEVEVILDRLNVYPPKLWAIGKLRSYSIQDQPFIHVDGDVYIWRKFGDRLEKATLIAQNKDPDQQHYSSAKKQASALHFEFPKILQNTFASNEKLCGVNAGILGGSDIDFFKAFYEKAIAFINSNLNRLSSNIVGSSFALLYEQLLFKVLANKQNKPIDYLFSSDELNQYDISNFFNKYGAKNYVHILSYKKRYLEHCKELESILKLEFPEYYYRIEKLCYDQQIKSIAL